MLPPDFQPSDFQNNRSRKAAYDLAGRTVRIENEMGQSVVYTHDAAGNRLTLTDANNTTTLFEYDCDGNLTAMTYPSVVGQPENIEQYQYDAANRLACKTTPNGDRIRTLYDPAGNIAALYHGAEVENVGAIPADRLIAKYERNGVGEVTKEEDPLTAMLYSFDAFGRLVEARDRTLGKSVRYAYDARSLRSKMEVVDYASSQTGAVSMSVTYGYNDAGRLATVKKDADPAAVYEYDLAGRRTKLTLPNGVSTEYTYDNADRLLDLTTRKDEIVLAKFAYTLDPTGNRTGITYADGSKSHYSFDNAYRLARDLRVDAFDQTLYNEAYAYDAIGNRLSKVRTGWNPVNVQYNYNTRNQLAFTTGTEPKAYSYDANGNTISIVSTSTHEIMNHDVLNRQIHYEGPGGVENTIYRGSGWHRWRTTEALSGSETAQTAFLYDGDNATAEYAMMSLSKLYVIPDLDEILSMTVLNPVSDVYYYSQDGLGNVRTVNDAAGALSNMYDYTAFGENYASTVVVPQRYGYTGRDQSAVIEGMTYHRHRGYISSSGRFDRRDPLGYADGVGLYEYAASRPTYYRDPYGLNSTAADDESCCNDRLDKFKNEIHSMWSEYIAGTNCFPTPPFINCKSDAATCRFKAGYNSSTMTIDICATNKSMKNDDEFLAAMAHELSHAAQFNCRGLGYFRPTPYDPYGPPQTCSERLCIEIAGYTKEYQKLNKKINKNEIIERAILSAWSYCVEKNTFYTRDNLNKIRDDMFSDRRRHAMYVMWD